MGVWITAPANRYESDPWRATKAHDCMDMALLEVNRAAARVGATGNAQEALVALYVGDGEAVSEAYDELES